MEKKKVRVVSRRGRREKKERRIGQAIILIIAIGMFLFSGWKLYGIGSEYKKGEAEYDFLQELVVEKVEVPKVQGDEDEAPVEESTVFTVDFEKLLAINSDTVAWIRFDEPSVINYPLVLSADNSDYLHTTFEGKKNAVGTLFVDYKNTGEFEDENTFIHGHNMKNGSMFGKLRKYRESGFGKANPYFYIYLPDGREVTYQVFAVCIVKDTSQTYDTSYENAEEFQEYIDYVKRCALYDTGVEVTTDSKIVSLSTCTNVTDDERLVVHGVKIGEKVVGE